MLVKVGNFSTIQIAMANSTDLQVEDFEAVPMAATLAFSWLKRTHLQPWNGRNVCYVGQIPEMHCLEKCKHQVRLEEVPTAILI